MINNNLLPFWYFNIFSLNIFKWSGEFWGFLGQSGSDKGSGDFHFSFVVFEKDLQIQNIKSLLCLCVANFQSASSNVVSIWTNKLWWSEFGDEIWFYSRRNGTLAPCLEKCSVHQIRENCLWCLDLCVANIEMGGS